MNSEQQISEEGNGCASSLMNTYFNRNTLIIGKRCSGKTSFVIHEIYRQLQSILDTIYVIVGDNCSIDQYSNITNKVYNSKELNEIYNNITQNHDKKSLIIFDDVIIDLLPPLTMESLLMSGCHLNTSVVIVSGYSIELKPNLRNNMDNYIVAEDNNISNIKRLYEQFFSIYPSFNSFQHEISQLKPYEFLCKSRDQYVNTYKVNINPNGLRFIKSNLEINGTNELKLDQQLVNRITQTINELVDIRNQLKNLVKK